MQEIPFPSKQTSQTVFFFTDCIWVETQIKMASVLIKWFNCKSRCSGSLGIDLDKSAVSKDYSGHWAAVPIMWIWDKGTDYLFAFVSWLFLSYPNGKREPKSTVYKQLIYLIVPTIIKSWLTEHWAIYHSKLNLCGTTTKSSILSFSNVQFFLWKM